MNDQQLRTVHALTLQWHAGATSLAYDAFRPWALQGLKAALPFDSAVWGLVPPGSAAGTAAFALVGVVAAGGDANTLQPLAQLQLAACAANAANASTLATAPVLNIDIADARWQQPAHEALRLQAERQGSMHALAARFVDANAPGQQFVAVSRKAATQRFADPEVAQFGWLAPHMMQAFATRRRRFLEQAAAAGQGPSAVAVALVDRDGFVHDQQAQFQALLRREWADWPGTRLPEPLLDLAARRPGASRRFVGAQMSFECLAAAEFGIVVVRPRHRADGLTEREGDIAQRYAAGGSFREVAASLHVAPATVRSHLRNVFGKLQVRNKAQLAAVLRQAA